MVLSALIIITIISIRLLDRDSEQLLGIYSDI